MVQLDPGERSILSYFPSSTRARHAAEELQKAGFDNLQIDRISRSGVVSDASINNPINRAVSQAGLTHFSDGAGDFLGDSTRVLLAADPSASGYGDKDYGIAGGRAFLLALVTSEDRVAEAVGIIREKGGMV